MLRKVVLSTLIGVVDVSNEVDATVDLLMGGTVCGVDGRADEVAFVVVPGVVVTVVTGY